jgi:hypothetical protein
MLRWLRIVPIVVMIHLSCALEVGGQVTCGQDCAQGEEDSCYFAYCVECIQCCIRERTSTCEGSGSQSCTARNYLLVGSGTNCERCKAGEDENPCCDKDSTPSYSECVNPGGSVLCYLVCKQCD